MKIVCLGDSLVYGYGVPRKDCWITLAAQRTGHELVNRGLNGDTTGGMLSRFRPCVLDQSPRRVLLLGGANDILTGNTDAAARSNLSAMVYQALDAGIAPMVGLYPPFRPEKAGPPWTGFVDVQALAGTFSAYRDWVLRFASAAGVPVVDFAAGFDSGDLYLDEVHPNRAGHQRMAEAFCTAIQH